MSLFKNFFHSLYRVMRVDLRHPQIRMPQQLLDSLQRRLVVQKMSGESVPQHVRTPLRQIHVRRQHLAYQIIYLVPAHRLSFVRHEKRSRRAPRHLSPLLQITPGVARQLVQQRDFPPLAPNTRTHRRPKSKSSTFRPASSLRRIPVS